MQDILRSISTAWAQYGWNDCLYAIKNFTRGFAEPLFIQCRLALWKVVNKFSRFSVCS